MKQHIRLSLLFPTLFILSLPLASVHAQPHVHGDRQHTHGLPAQGIGHKHGNTAPGRAVGGQKPVQRTQQKQVPTRPNNNVAQNNRAIAGNPNAELKQAYKQKIINVFFR